MFFTNCSSNFCVIPKTTTTTTMTTTSTTPSSTTTPYRCPPDGANIDLAVVIDHSNSIGSKNFKLMQNFLVQFLENFDVDSGQVQISLVPYSSGTLPIDHLKKFKTNQEVTDSLMSRPYKGGHTATGKALQDVKKKVFKKKNGLREDSKKVVLVVTDGVTTVGAKPKEPAEALRRDGAAVFAMGIRGARESELISMTGNPNRVIQIKEFEHLSSALASALTRSICSGDT